MVRSLVLLRPFITISKKFIVGILVGYAVFVFFRQLVGILLGYGMYQYDSYSGYCWNNITHRNYEVGEFLKYILPIILPFLFSYICFISKEASLIHLMDLILS